MKKIIFILINSLIVYAEEGRVSITKLFPDKDQWDGRVNFNRQRPGLETEMEPQHEISELEPEIEEDPVIEVETMPIPQQVRIA